MPSITTSWLTIATEAVFAMAAFELTREALEFELGSAITQVWRSTSKSETSLSGARSIVYAPSYGETTYNKTSS